MTAPDDEARAFAATFRRFLEWVHAHAPATEDNEVVRLLRDHLGSDGASTSVVTKDLPPFEHVNLQVALDAWSVQDGRTVTVAGLVRQPQFGPVDLSMLLHAVHLPPVRLSAPDLVDLASGPDRTLACLTTGLLLVRDERAPTPCWCAGRTCASSHAWSSRWRGWRPPRHRTYYVSWPSCGRNSTSTGAS